ncbi:MAG: amidohydrolase family protein [Candidatus Thorarchaeota archaeon]|nr:amidohydrolase family protein [Candidatus Thorarchaeota archaeon]
MLIVRALEDIPAQGIKEGDTFRFYIVDTHHHMGREKTHKNTPGGAYDFYQLLWFEMKRLIQRAMEDDKLLFEPVEITAPAFPSRIFNSRKSWKRMNHGWLIDKTIVFPYTDDYSTRGKNGEPSFKVSNDKIAGWTTRAPHSSRLIGFGRVNPSDAQSGPPDIAVRELERAILQLGLRGLKLHPLAQLFIDELEDDITKRVLHKAGELAIPVLFDTRNMRTAIRIKKLVDSMREDETHSASVRQLKIILAHCGMNPGDSKLYDILRDPAFTADTSTLHDQDIPLLFDMAITRIKSSEKRWSESLLFGTDYSFLSVQAAELILYTFSREFPGTLGDVQRILGGNALSLIQRPFRTARKTKRSPRQLACPNDGDRSRSIVENGIISLLHNDEWELSSLDTMLPPHQTWPEPVPEIRGGFNGVYIDSFVATLRSKEVEYELHLWLRDNPANLLTLASLGTSGEDSLQTTEYATHEIGERLIEELTRNTRHERDANSLVESIPRLFK